MQVSTKSLPPSIKNLLTLLGRKVRTVELEVVVGAFVRVNTASYRINKTATTSMVTIDPSSRGSYMGDDGESHSEKMAEFHGPVAIDYGSSVRVSIPRSNYKESSEAAVLAWMCAAEGVQQNTDPISKVPANANPEVLVALDAFIPHLQAITTEYYSTKYPTLPIDTIGMEYGKKFARIFKINNSGGRSVHCFIDLTTGDVLKAAGWKAPAKGVRGNILARDPSKYGVTVYGANYLR